MEDLERETDGQQTFDDERATTWGSGSTTERCNVRVVARSCGSSAARSSFSGWAAPSSRASSPGSSSSPPSGGEANSPVWRLRAGRHSGRRCCSNSTRWAARRRQRLPLPRLLPDVGGRLDLARRRLLRALRGPTTSAGCAPTRSSAGTSASRAGHQIRATGAPTRTRRLVALLVLVHAQAPHRDGRRQQPDARDLHALGALLRHEHVGRGAARTRGRHRRLRAHHLLARLLHRRPAALLRDGDGDRRLDHARARQGPTGEDQPVRVGPHLVRASPRATSSGRSRACSTASRSRSP